MKLGSWRLKVKSLRTWRSMKIRTLLQAEFNSWRVTTRPRARATLPLRVMRRKKKRDTTSTLTRRKRWNKSISIIFDLCQPLVHSPSNNQTTYYLQLAINLRIVISQCLKPPDLFTRRLTLLFLNLEGTIPYSGLNSSITLFTKIENLKLDTPSSMTNLY